MNVKRLLQDCDLGKLFLLIDDELNSQRNLFLPPHIFII